MEHSNKKRNSPKKDLPELRILRYISIPFAKRLERFPLHLTTTSNPTVVAFRLLQIFVSYVIQTLAAGGVSTSVSLVLQRMVMLRAHQMAIHSETAMEQH